MRIDTRCGEAQPVLRRADMAEMLRSLAAITSSSRGQTIYGREDPAEYWYRVDAGAARALAVQADGRRQIVDFLLPGDFFGFGERKEEQCYVTEAIVDGTLVSRYPRRRIEMLADSDPRIGRLVRTVAFKAMSRLETRAIILGERTARAKVGAFLLEMAERSPGGAADEVDLPMSRYDVADYLAISVETVSRALTVLRLVGVIRFTHARRRMRILDRAALANGDDDGLRQHIRAGLASRARH